MLQQSGLRRAGRGTLVTAAVAAAAAALVAGGAAAGGREPPAVAADVLVGCVWVVVAVGLWPRERTRRTAGVVAAFALAWVLGSLDPALALLHRGPLAHLVLAYPTGRLGSWPARAAVTAAYLDGILAGQFGGPVWTLGFSAGLILAAALRYVRAAGPGRRMRVVPLVAACAVGGVLAAGALVGLAGGAVDVVVVYEVVLVLAGLAVARDLHCARWSAPSITGLVVDLGERPIGGLVRTRLARAVGDPTLGVGYVLDDDRRPVDEHGEPVELPGPADRRVVTRAVRAGEPLAVLVHDPTVLDDPSVIDGAASVLSVAVANARLQADVRARVANVEASTLRLRDAADGERRRLAAALRARVDPLLERAADQLQGIDAGVRLTERLEEVRSELFGLAAGLDPPHLRERGLATALEVLAQHSAVPVSVAAPAERFPAAVETCAWFVCSEALANALKHSSAGRVEIHVHSEGDRLRLEVRDDGVGGADPARGSGLARLTARVASVGGCLAVESPPGGGTRLVAELDVRPSR